MFVVGIEGRGKHAALAQILVGHHAHQMAAAFEYAHPVRQRDIDLAHMLQTVRRVHEIEAPVGDGFHFLRIAVLQVPGTAGLHLREKFVILGQRIRSRTDIDAVADKITRRITRVVQPVKDGFAGFVHGVYRQKVI